MASVLNLSLLEGFGPIFLFLLIFAVMYGVMSWTKLFGTTKWVHAIVAVVVAFIILLTEKAVIVIKTMIPWFIVLFVMLIFTIIAFKIFGAKDDWIMTGVTENGTLKWALIVVSLVIFAFSLSAAYGQESLQITQGSGTVVNESITLGNPGTTTGTTNTGSFSNNMGQAIYNPKMLGFILIMLIAVFTVSQLTSSNT
jgi:hypothetical protein